MNQEFEKFILSSTGATSLGKQELIQTLWSGYGQILKIALSGTLLDSIIVKFIDLPQQANHPRGWNTNRSHQRKVKSYNVEMAWYDKWSVHCNNNCRVPKSYASLTSENKHLIVMEDLDAAGYSLRKGFLNSEEVLSCLKWLAHFHAAYLDREPTGLWDVGTYWHLATRPDELKEMALGPLKTHASEIDKKLNSCKYKTFVHGDAKVANFCFSHDNKVAAVDFQYVGGGCGMKDVAYFLGSCLGEDECQQNEKEFLNYYFTELKVALEQHGKGSLFSGVEQEWRGLFSWAWTDFYRFLLGWMPTHSKINSYTKILSERVLKELS